MQDKDEMLRQMRASSFRENNGTVLNAINIMQIKYVRLRDILSLLERDMNEAEILKSVNFLQRAEYIELRHVETREDVLLADAKVNDLEVIVSEKGIRLMLGGVKDTEVVFKWR